MTGSEKYQAVLVATACHIASHFTTNTKLQKDLKKVGDKALTRIPDEERAAYFQQIAKDNPALQEFLTEGTNCLQLDQIFTVGEAVKIMPTEILAAVLTQLNDHLGVNIQGMVEEVVDLGISAHVKNNRRVFIVPPTPTNSHLN